MGKVEQGPGQDSRRFSNSPSRSPSELHCLTKNLTLYASTNTASGIIVAFSIIALLHKFPLAEKTGSPYNAFSRVGFLVRQSGEKFLSCR
jgi:hypothetical protein